MCRRSWRSSEMRARVTRRGLSLDLVLELVDLRVDVVDEIEVALGDVVDEPVGEHPRRVRLSHRRLHNFEVVRWSSAGRCLPHRDERVRRDHEPDLLVVDGVLFGDSLREKKDAEDVPAVPTKRGTRLVVMLRRLEEQLDRRLLELARALRAELVGGRVEEIDPLRGHLPRIRRTEV